ncbi:hypothetical protein QFZ37_001208 [Chryseobacterium ginsenosidimutans]|nr:hypothetical protein [Chryseobacterium ginsenosidimutans]
MTVNIVILSILFVDNLNRKRLIFINFGTTFKLWIVFKINIFNYKYEF